jgi:tetratricopeptide (TPR) repeat protein
MSQRAQEILNILLQNHKQSSQVPEYKALLAATYRNLGEIYLVRQLPHKADAPLTEAGNLYDELAKSQDLPEFREAWAISYAQLGQAFAKRADTREKAEKLQLRALQTFERLVKEHPEVPQYLYDLGRAYDALGESAREAGHYKRALERFDRAIEIMDDLVGRDFKRSRHARLATKINRTIALARMGDHARASGEAEAQVRQMEALARQERVSAIMDYNLGCAFAVCSQTAHDDAALTASERMRLEVLYADRAMEFLEQARKKDAPFNEKDPDLDSLRTRPDFKKWLEEMKKKQSKK